MLTSTDAGPALRADVDACLAPGARLRHFPPVLARLYEQRLGQNRRRHLAVALALTSVAVLVAGLLDHVNAPAHFRGLLIPRCIVFCLSLGCIPAVLWSRPGLREGLAFGLPLAAQVSLSALVCAAAPPSAADRTIVMCLILISVLCAVPPVSMRLASVVAISWFWCFALTLFLVSGTTQALHHLPALAAGAFALAVGVVLSWRRERARRQEFLYVLHAQLSAAELASMNAELERLTNTDFLTGVANRRRFESDLRAAWADASGNDISAGIGLLMVDVDHFKAFNDCAGHAEGDDCLRAIASAIAGVVRGGACAMARWGGEEFVVLAPCIAQADLASLGERVRRAVASIAIPHPARPGETVSISIGAAWCGPGAPCATPDDLLRRADHALYTAKSAGRDQVHLAAWISAR